MSNRLILGDGGHGKDTVADILCNANKTLRTIASSKFAAQKFMIDVMADKYNIYYKNFEECFIDRRNNRKIWHEEIALYNTPDKAKLAREILKDYDIYTGMRCDQELTAVLKADLFDLIYWVDAGDRVPRESKDSIKIDYEMVLNHPDRKAPLVFVDNSANCPSKIIFYPEK